MQLKKRLFIIKNTNHLTVMDKYLAQNIAGQNYVLITVNKAQNAEALIKTIKADSKLFYAGCLFLTTNNILSLYGRIIRNILFIKRIKKRLDFVDEILFTNYKSWSHHYIISQVNSKKIILLSDGAGILLASKMRQKSPALPVSLLPLGNNGFIGRHLIKINPIPKLHFFSQIEMEIPASDSLEVFKYAGAKDYKVDPEKIYFIGSPTVELDYLKIESKLHYLQELTEAFAGKSITYFAHPKEKANNLENYKVLARVIQAPLPFEEYLRQEKELPCIIISFFSSVLINLAPVYPDIIFYYMPLESKDIDVNLEFKEKYTVVMQGFKQITRENFRRLPHSISHS